MDGTVCLRTLNRQVPMGLVGKGKFRNLGLAQHYDVTSWFLIKDKESPFLPNPEEELCPQTRIQDYFLSFFI